jgi:ribosomal protein S18 acetylase RimI-like enzyme
MRNTAGTDGLVMVRRCVSADFDGVVPLLRELWPDKHLDLEALRVVWESAMSSASQIYVCATESDCVIGFGSLSWKNNLWQEGLLAHVDELVVHSRHRGKGVGTKILSHLTDMARARGCKRLELDSAHHRTGAHEFYAAHGFQNQPACSLNLCDVAHA